MRESKIMTRTMTKPRFDTLLAAIDVAKEHWEKEPATADARTRLMQLQSAREILVARFPMQSGGES